jgi:hypothetical protein
MPARTTAPPIPIPAPAPAERLCGEGGPAVDCGDEDELERPIDVDTLAEITEIEVTIAEVNTVVEGFVTEFVEARIAELSTCHHIGDTVEFP